MSAHARLSPSSAHRWMACPGSVALEQRCLDVDSRYADEGTAAHEVARLALMQGDDAQAYIGQRLLVGGRAWDVDDDMARHVQVYLDHVRRINGPRLIEQPLSIEGLTGENGAAGTPDAVVVEGDALHIVDLKYGRGVRVDARENKQLMLYGLAALHALDSLGAYADVHMHIVQPRLDHIDTWTVAADDLRAFSREVREAAKIAWVASTATLETLHADYLSPGTEQCRWCKAKSICPAVQGYVLGLVADDFVDLGKPVAPQLQHAHARQCDPATLGHILGALDLIEDWCAAMRARAQAELEAGREVPGFKLVAGKRGARKWTDATLAEAALLGAGVDPAEAFTRTLISPTAAERLRKAGALTPEAWASIVRHIEQPEGRPTIAPDSDKRAALAPASDFEVLA